MLSVGIVSPGGLGYYSDTVGSGRDDYYLRCDPGTWMGAGAEALGLVGEATAEQFGALGAGRNPVSGETIGQGATKVAAFDLCFSAPKSLSVALLADPATREAVIAAHDQAVADALGFLETEGVLAGRRGHGGLRKVPTTGAIAAGFGHRSSRTGDPQVHTHLLIFNRAQGIDSKWGGLDGRRLFAWAKTAGYVYQSSLRNLTSEALGATWQPVRNGLAELEPFSDSQLQAFSTRRAEIDAELARSGNRGARAAQVATLATRPSKAEGIDAEVQRQVWRARAVPLGVDEALFARAFPGPSLDRPATPLEDPERLDVLTAAMAAPSGLTAHRSAFDRRDVIRALAETWPGGARASDISQAATSVLGSPGISPTGSAGQHAGPLYSTGELMALETGVLDSTARRFADTDVVCAPAAVETAIVARPSLSGEQAAMVRGLCTSGRGVQVVVGRAGTGMTFALDAARQAWTDSGVSVIGAALAARTAASLQADTGIPSTTVDQLLSDLGRPGDGGLPRRGVLVVDEAGMVGTRKLARLLDAARSSKTKVVLVGDPRQLPEVEAGGAFAVLAQADPIELSTNRRQVNAWERDALDQLRHGDVERAVAIYSDNGRVTLASSAEQARRHLVGDWWAARTHVGPDRVAMIALHQADVDDLNDLARQTRKDAGELSGPEVTAASGRAFAVGDEVMALRNDRRLGILNGTRATVSALRLEVGGLELIDGSGRAVTLPCSYLDDGFLAHGYAITAHKAQGLTTGQAFVLGSDRLYREAGYTAMSRAAERSDLYHVALPATAYQPARDPYSELVATLRRSGAQNLATQPGHRGHEPGFDAAVGIDRRALLDAALADPGEHLLDRLGPPPLSGRQREAWSAAATAIETYRARHSISGTDALGPRPVEADALREWGHAEAAALSFDAGREKVLDHHLSL